jgi:CheY-like chemotaxis protein
MSKKAVNRQRVLVVDDDPETRESVGQALEQAGFYPTLAAMGEQGLVLLREWPRRIDWLYTKAELPGLVDGWILAEEFHQAHPSRPVLYRVPRHTKRPSYEGGIALSTPVSPRRVAEVLLRLTQSGDVPAAELTRWAA